MFVYPHNYLKLFTTDNIQSLKVCVGCVFQAHLKSNSFKYLSVYTFIKCIFGVTHIAK